eukprot:jgi/Botrbrau1/18472/Bobra.0072s0054.1
MAGTVAHLTSSVSFITAPRTLPVRCCRPNLRASRRRRFVLTAQNKTPQEIGQEIVQSVGQECRNFLERYDVVSTGVGALSVTTYCVWRGQDPWLALSITAASVVTALVVNEVFYGNEQERQ